MQFFIEIVMSGILSGLMYSLVALGFVLIFKASGVLNFAQGSMVYTAALAVVGLIDMGMPMWLAILAAFLFMVLVGICTERFVLGKLVNQPPISLFMATIGLSFFLDGLAPILFGSEIRPINLGIVDEPIQSIMTATGIGISKLDLFSSFIILILVLVLTLLFQYTRVGRALRAVADDHQAALSLGIPLENIWAIVWAIAGFVALVAGLLWGARNGVQYALSLTALKALPVLILGGFTSVPGAVIGGVIIGVSEKLAEIYIPPVLQGWFGGNFGGIEGWFPYIFALLFLLVRPEGLFGEKHIDRV
jgi:branched-chain amino acid transport system permease protein